LILLGIHYIVGRSGSGKTMRIYGEIGRALQNGEKKLILMVPEQFTLQAERDLIQYLNLPGILDVEVLSFSRLAYKIFNEAGGLTRIHINEQGRHMILRRILDGLQDQLTVYRTVSRQNGFIKYINDLLSDLKKHDITPQQLTDKADQLEGSVLLAGKLRDTAIIYEAFNKYLADKYIDSEDAINALVDRMEKSSYLSGARIWMDGFDYFPPQTLRVIEKLILAARELTIAFTLEWDQKSRDSDIFKVHALSLQKVKEIAGRHNLEEKITDLTCETNSGKNNNFVKAPEIRHLEQELYKYPYKTYEAEVKHIKAFAGSNPELEVERMAACIISLSREKGWRFKEMAVVTGDLPVYGSIIKRIFPDYGIPYFIDEKKPVMQNPIADFILTVLRVIERGYRYEDVFKLLKSGFCGFSREQVEILENYCLEFGIKGNKWKQAFELGCENYPLEMLETCRKTFINPLLKLEKNLKGSSYIQDMISALYAHLSEIHLQEQLENWVAELKGAGRLELAEENAQIWKIVVDIFDQMVEILGDQKVSSEEFHRILESGFSSIETGIIPTTLDQVLVGSVQRSKSQHVKALFIVGLNDGILPAGSREEGLLAPDERDHLLKYGLNIGGNTELVAADEKFGIYTALSKPSDFLWVSYALSDTEGRALRKSILIDRIKKLFPGLQFSEDIVLNEEQQQEMVSTPASTYKYMLNYMRAYADGKEIFGIKDSEKKDSLLWWLVYDWYRRQPEWKEKTDQLIKALFHSNQEAPLGRKKAAALYSLPVRASVSRLEQFVKCPYAHFVKYGLRPVERKEFTVAAPDLGELFHRSIEGFTRRIAEEKLDWRTLDDAQCEKLLEQVMDQVISEHNHGVLQSTRRYQYLSKRIKRITGRAVWLLTDHIRRSKFNPIGYEISFGSKGTYPPIEIELPNGEIMLLEGRIDRADVCQTEDGVYVNVIDYKSGAENFDLADAWFGLKLQLLVYLEALLELENRRTEGKARPGGIFYFRIDDPFINTQDSTVEAIQKEIRKKLKLSGLVLKDVNIIRSMDSQINGWSEVLPVCISAKNDSIDERSSVLNEQEFFGLLKHIRQLVSRIGMDMLEGNIHIEPMKKGKVTACRYCPYKGICQFDRQLKDNKYRIIPKMEKADLLRQLVSGKEEE